MAKKTRKRFDTGGYMGEFDSAADAKRYVESSDWQRPYSIKKINKTPKVVRTQFEEEVFEYADGGETYANYEMVLIAKELEKDGGYKHKFRYLVSAKDINEAKNIVTEQWYEEMSNSDLSLVNIMSDEEYRLNHMGKKMAKGGETKPSLIPDYKKISNVEVEDIDRDDYPDFSDAYISYAEYDGEPMTDEQLEELNQDGLFVYDAIHMRLFADGGKVRQNKKDKLWESIKNKFSEIFYLKETDSNEIFSNYVTAEKKEYLYFASAWVTTTLSFEEAENKFKRMLTEDEKKIIKIERNVKDINEAFGVMSEKKILVKRIDKMADGGMMARGGMIWASPTLRKKYESAFGKDFKAEYAIQEIPKKILLIESYYWNYLLDVLEIEELDEKAANDWKVAKEVEDGKFVQKGPYASRYMYSPSLNKLREQTESEWYEYGSASDFFADGGMMDEIQFDRDRNGSLYDRGRADSYYGRAREPHWYPNGTYNGEMVTELTKKEIEEYNKGYNENTDFKDYGEMAKGGKVKSRWIQDALTGNKGALRRTAKRKGLIRGDEKLSKSDLRKLEKMGGKTARRARLAETLIDFKK